MSPFHHPPPRFDTRYVLDVVGFLASLFDVRHVASLLNGLPCWRSFVSGIRAEILCHILRQWSLDHNRIESRFEKRAVMSVGSGDDE